MIPLITISRIKYLKAPINHIIALFIIFLFISPTASQTPPSPESSYYNGNIKHGLGLIVFILTVFIFFMAFFSIYIRHCNEDSSVAGARLSSVISGRNRRGNRGLDPTVLGTFPVFNYSAVKEMKIGKGALECAVCINEFEDDETLRLIPKCDHVFHSECIDMWLHSHDTCPVCRANLALVQGEPIDAPVLGQTAQAHNQTGTGNQNDDVAIDVAASGGSESMEQPLNERPRRSLIRSGTRVNTSGRRRWFGLFLRSHSTGHVAVYHSENTERFTLRLPEEVRRQIISGKLSRTTSCVAPPTESSYRVGHRVGFGGSYKEGSSQGKYGSGRFFDPVNRWGFSLTPQLFSTAPKMAPPDSLRTAQAS